MIVPVVLLVLSVAGLGAAILLPGMQDFILLAGPMALAALWLLLRAWFARGGPAQGRPGRTPAEPRPEDCVVVDGSNVLHWQDNTPSLDTLTRVLALLQARGLVPFVVFDANAGYKLGGGYRHDRSMARLIGLPERQVVVVPKGTPADAHILAAARSMGVRILSNDRFRDWQADYPEVAEPGHVIRGSLQDGQPRLDLP